MAIVCFWVVRRTAANVALTKNTGTAALGQQNWRPEGPTVGRQSNVRVGR